MPVRLQRPVAPETRLLLRAEVHTRQMYLRQILLLNYSTEWAETSETHTPFFFCFSFPFFLSCKLMFVKFVCKHSGFCLGFSKRKKCHRHSLLVSHPWHNNSSVIDSSPHLWQSGVSSTSGPGIISGNIIPSAASPFSHWQSSQDSRQRVLISPRLYQTSLYYHILFKKARLIL